MTYSKSNRERWIILSILCLPVFIGSLDLTIVSAILPEVITELRLSLDTTYDEASWALGGYLLAYTISMTFTGRLSDIVGRRWVYVVCLAIFMFGSWFVTIADGQPAEWYLDVYRQIFPNPDTHTPPSLESRQLYMFILGRVIQALGAGAMVPVTMALVSDMFPPAQRPRPLGFVGAVDTAGWVLGHLYGGIMVKLFGDYGTEIADFLGTGIPDWRWLFLFNIPISLIAIGGAWYALRDSDFVAEGNQRFDWIGTALITLTLIGLNVGLGSPSPESNVGADNIDSPARPEFANYLLVVAVITFVAFIFWELRARHPLIKLSQFRKRNFSAAGFANLCLGFALAIGLVSVPILINIRLDDPSRNDLLQAALSTGLVLSGLTVPMALTAVPGGWLTERYGYRLVTASGMALAVLGFVISGLHWNRTIDYEIMALEISIIGIGLGLTISPISAALINDSEAGQLGVAAALVLVLRLIGMTAAISGLTIYALDRIDERVIALPPQTGIDDPSPYLIATFDQMNELYFIGAAVCALGLLAALMLRGGNESQGTQIHF
jgi:MFS family permease